MLPRVVSSRVSLAADRGRWFYLSNANGVSLWLERKCKESQTSTPTNVGVLRVRKRTGWIKFPWVGVKLLVQMDVAERINDVMARRNELPVDVNVRSHVLSHGRVRLRQPGCLAYHRIEDGRRTLPCIQRDLSECSREIEEGSAGLVRRQRVREHERFNLRVGLCLPLGVCTDVS